MSDPTAPNDAGAPTPAPEATPSQTRADARQARADRAGRLEQIGRAALGLPGGEPPAEPAPPAAVPTPPQPPPESQILRRLEAAQSEAHGYRSRLEEIEAKYREVQARADEYGQLRESVADPEGALRAMQRLGIDFSGLLDAVADGKVKPPQPYAELPPEVAERMKQLEERASAWEKAQAEEAARSEQAAQLQRRQAEVEADIPYVREQVEALGEEYAPLAASPGLIRQVVEMAHAEIDAGADASSVDLKGLMGRANEAVMNDAKSLLSNEAAVKRLCADPDTRATLLRVLGATAPGDGAPTRQPHGLRHEAQASIPESTTAEMPSQTQPVSRAERKRRLREAGARALGLTD